MHAATARQVPGETTPRPVRAVPGRHEGSHEQIRAGQGGRNQLAICSAGPDPQPWERALKRARVQGCASASQARGAGRQRPALLSCFQPNVHPFTTPLPPDPRRLRRGLHPAAPYGQARTGWRRKGRGRAFGNTY